MSTILISIRPEHVRSILNGTKRYEFRKVPCSREVDRMVIYSTSPVMKIVAEAEIRGIIEDDPESVWQRTEDGAGISREFFDRYYEGRETAVAFELGDVRKFDEPRELSQYGISNPPQSFIYL